MYFIYKRCDFQLYFTCRVLFWVLILTFCLARLQIGKLISVKVITRSFWYSKFNKPQIELPSDKKVSNLIIFGNRTNTIGHYTNKYWKYIFSTTRFSVVIVYLIERSIFQKPFLNDKWQSIFYVCSNTYSQPLLLAPFYIPFFIERRKITKYFLDK